MMRMNTTRGPFLRTGLLLMLLTFLLGGCAPSFSFGNTPRINRLSELRRGVSTASDVRRVLGEPRGKGATHIPVGMRALWLYDSGSFDGNSRRNQLRFLLVFMDGETYDGYLWFDIDTKFEERHGA